ncbi:MAG TPA: family 16 glycosylhydrolase [Bacteroidales bacterium]|nr:family 16 glycosylhydrolase [Bacteroidales bacterium]
MIIFKFIWDFSRAYFYVFCVLLMIISASCEKDSTQGKYPKLLVGDTEISISEDEPNGVAEIPMYLSIVPKTGGSFEYYTADSTAKAGKDYKSISREKISFKPGETYVIIRVEIIPNSEKIYDAAFKIKLENAENCVLPGSELVIKILNTDYETLVWSDEFNGGSLSTVFWNYETGGGGWGNNELQTYTNSNENVHLDSGYLHITALNPSPGSYTSGRITTKGKKEFTNGKVEIRAMLPEGKGLWPALWMLGANFSSVGWPTCGEIDIMESLGHAPSTSYGALHWNLNGHTYVTGTYNLPSGKFSTEFHVFSLVWTPTRIRWFVDGNQFFSKTREEIKGFPIRLPMFFIFNVAVGGTWPGNPDQTTTFPQHMIVDYIRVYQ